MGQSTPTKKNKNSLRNPALYLIIVPSLILPAVLLFLIGETKWGFLALGLLPFFFIMLGLSNLLGKRLTPPRLREIYNHMTEDERRRFEIMAKTHGKKYGIFFGVFGGGIYPVLHSILGVTNYVYYIIPFAFLLLIAIALGLRGRKAFIRFALTTEYAKEKGWDTI